MPSLDRENQIKQETGIQFIAGLDEAGRGALAGPVTAAAVILPLDSTEKIQVLSAVDDSKKLSPKSRSQLFDLITRHAVTFGIGFSPAQMIDEYGIITATKEAMKVALSQLNPPAAYLLIDGRIRLKSPPLPQEAIIHGDAKCLTIAAASILAKVSRDRHMAKLNGLYSEFGFSQNKGYGTAYHLEMIQRLGPTPEHRHSFSPIRKKLI